jgi:hypothetical protein
MPMAPLPAVSLTPVAYFPKGKSHLARVDLNGWTLGKPATPEITLTFDDRVRRLNGSTMLGPGVLALADCFAGLIWRADLSDGAHSATARVWLSHDTMAWDPDSAVEPPPQPGVNGVRYGAKTGYPYCSSSICRTRSADSASPGKAQDGQAFSKEGHAP